MTQELDAERSTSAERIGQLDREVANWQKRVALIESSTSWKVVSKIRSALEGYPKTRVFVRRLTRVLWWTVSLQLVSQLRSHRRLLAAADTISRSALFDAAWYLSQYPDVATAGWDPALHYTLFGAIERRNPGPDFDTGWYLDHNPDVAAAGQNPLLHYLQWGRSEGRLPRRGPRAEAYPTPVASTDASAAKAAMTALHTGRLALFLSSSATLALPTTEHPDVTVVLVLHNRAELTFACLNSIRECLWGSSVGIEVIVLDNASTDLTARLLDRVQGANIVRSSENLHFLRGVNHATKFAKGRHILLLNNDAQLLPGTLEAAVRTLDSDKDIGAVGARIVLPNGVLQEAGSIIWRDGTCVGYGRGCHPDHPEVMFRRDVDFCSAAFLLTPRPLFESLGGFDEIFAPAYYEEVDYSVRLWRRGLRVTYEPEAVIVHYEFGSAASSEEALALQRRNHKLFSEKHADWLSGRSVPSQGNLLSARTAIRTGKRVLIVEDRIPKPSLGRGYPRSCAMIQAFVEEGAQVTFFPMFETEDTWRDVRETLSPLIEVLLGATSERLHNFLCERRGYFDAILVCRPHNMRAFLVARQHDPHIVEGAALIYDAEAIFATRELLRRELAGELVDTAEANRMIAEEVDLAQGADLVLSVSTRERDLFLRNGISNVNILGYPVQIRPTGTDFQDRTDVLFLGTISDEGSPNADSLRWFASDILPSLRREIGAGLRLKVVGLNTAASIAALDGSALELIGAVDDLTPHFERARLVVVPTRFAAGISLKALEAAGFGVPTVVTDLIASQLGWSNGCECLIASEGRAFAAECARLYRSRELWETLRLNALSRVREDCCPEHFHKMIKHVIDVVESRPWVQPPLTTTEERQAAVRTTQHDADTSSEELASLRSYADSLFASERLSPRSNLQYVHRTEECLDSSKLSVKAIAFYLPQFHPIPENDKWWGKGFTEWSNVTRALPQFPGHYQPRLPADLGFYDLRAPGVMRQQVDIARQYGVFGFCFHHYWFGGKRLLEFPIDQFLTDSSLNLGFCICWANENWTRRWDGSDHEILIAQQHSSESDQQFIESLLPYFADSRYVRIDGKPLLLVYRIDLLPDPGRTVESWRTYVKSHGISDLYVVAARSFDVSNLRDYGLDGAVEFPPHQTFAKESTENYKVVNPDFKGTILDYRELAERFGRQEWRDLPTFKTVFPSWDNEARKPGWGTIFTGSDPMSYATWLEDACSVTVRRRPEERLLFINAWNEWAEGAYLEPDRKFGYGYLHATSTILRKHYCDPEIDEFIANSNAEFVKRNNVALVCHCFHQDILPRLSRHYIEPHRDLVDLVATVRSDVDVSCLMALKAQVPNVFFIKTENRGRDIRPFLYALAFITSRGYQYACKIHTKKSPHLEDEGRWREALVGPLLGREDTVARVTDVFAREKDLGLLVPPGSLIDLGIQETYQGNVFWLNQLLTRLKRPELIGSYQVLFPAGSMYWFRVAALNGLQELVDQPFEPELGQRDGTLAHSIERIVSLYAWERGYRTRELREDDQRTFTSDSEGFSVAVHRAGS